jgi:hypothetical protein
MMRERRGKEKVWWDYMNMQDMMDIIRHPSFPAFLLGKTPGSV